MGVFCTKHGIGIIFCRQCDLEVLAQKEQKELEAHIERLKTELITGVPTLARIAERATLEPSLAKALSWIAVWETERAIRQARNNETWETCFEILFTRVLADYPHPLIKKV